MNWNTIYKYSFNSMLGSFIKWFVFQSLLSTKEATGVLIYHQIIKNFVAEILAAERNNNQ